MDEQKAFEIVLNKLKECPLFCGRYDATHGDDHFMYGVEMVMEYISYYVSDETGMAFEREFYDNIVESKRRVGRDV